MIKNISIFILFSMGFALIAFANNLVSSSSENAQVYIISPLDGQTVSQSFTVKFGLREMGIAPAGVNHQNTGHHHLLIDSNVLPDLTKPLIASDKLQHFGGGQTETKLVLTPGKHTLQLLLGNYLHIPHNKAVISKKITILVK